MMDGPNYINLTLERGLAQYGPGDDSYVRLQKELSSRVAGLASEHSLFRLWCDRADNLYYTTTFTDWGADLWPDDASATTPGRSHVSINTPSVYVDIPAALQAFPPIENMLATEDSDEKRKAANSLERIYKAWKMAEKFDLKFHKATTIKALYGRTAGYVYYDRELERPCVSVVQNPRNLYLGYKSDDYESLEWAAYVTLRDPNSVVEEYSVELSARATPEGIMPWIVGGLDANRPRPELSFGPARIEVWDYWFRRPGKAGKPGQPTKMQTWNVVIAGDKIVREEYQYKEYGGEIPYKPLYNTFIPGTPTGRSELHDMEQLIREKMTRITAGAQMIRKATAGDYWQLIGPDAPTRVGDLKPEENKVVGPGAGNRIEAITPYIAQFQLEQYLGRLDREMSVVSGLNDLLLGLAPAQVLSSSKAINALIANYETRIAMRRLLLYTWRRDLWELAAKVYAAKNKHVQSVMDAGGGTLEIIDPSLSPRDEGETAVRAGNLVGAKLWSQVRGMDAVGVDDPEQEQDIIRGESTDATLFPERVQLMAQLLGALQSLGIQAPANAQDQAQQQLSRGQNDLRTALGAGTAQGDTGSQGAELQGQTPQAALTPGATPPSDQPFASGPPQAQLQSLIQNGQVKGRILTSQKLGRK